LAQAARLARQVLPVLPVATVALAAILVSALMPRHMAVAAVAVARSQAQPVVAAAAAAQVVQGPLALHLLGRADCQALAARRVSQAFGVELVLMAL